MNELKVFFPLSFAASSWAPLVSPNRLALELLLLAPVPLRSASASASVAVSFFDFPLNFYFLFFFLCEILFLFLFLVRFGCVVRFNEISFPCIHRREFKRHG